MNRYKDATDFAIKIQERLREIFPQSIDGFISGIWDRKNHRNLIGFQVKLLLCIPGATNGTLPHEYLIQLADHFRSFLEEEAMVAEMSLIHSKASGNWTFRFDYKPISAKG